MKENSCCKEKEIFPCLYYPVLSWQEILSMASVRKRELLCGAPEEIEKLKEMSICAPKKNPETEFAVGRETAHTRRISKLLHGCYWRTNSCLVLCPFSSVRPWLQEARGIIPRCLHWTAARWNPMLA